MMDLTSATDRYLRAIEERKPLLPSWAEARRREWATRFAMMGWPHQRQEAWRFTDVTPAIQAELELAPRPEVELNRADIEAWSIKEATAEIVFVDGVYSGRLSRRGRTRRSFSLAEAISKDSTIVRRYLGDITEDPTDAFMALNGAFLQDGPLVHATRSADAGLIHVLHIATGNRVSHPRGLIMLGKGAECRVVETFAAVDGGARLTNQVSEIVLEEGARLDHVKVVEGSDAAYHLGTTVVALLGNNAFTSNCISLGGKIVRNALYVAFDGEGSESLLRGLYLADSDRLVDNTLHVDHAAPQCMSRVAYKGILDGSGHAVYTGSVLVEPGAQKTDSNQVNSNLVLSDSARIDTKPQLRILADDVKCTHGATVGQPSPESIYYFKTRGIDEPMARRMLTCGFAAEILGHLKVQSLKERLTRNVFDRLERKNDS